MSYRNPLFGRNHGGIARANPRPGHIPEPMPPKSIKWGLMLADENVSGLYETLSEEGKASVRKPAASFLRRWYDDRGYEDYATVAARSRLREEVLLQLQLDIPT